MRDAVFDTSVLQYLHRLRLMHFLPRIFDRIFVPPAVIRELENGRRIGIDVPTCHDYAWIDFRAPSKPAFIFFQSGLGAGEAEVLRLCLEINGSIAILDDRTARREAKQREIDVMGTVSIIIKLKDCGAV